MKTFRNLAFVVLVASLVISSNHNVKAGYPFVDECTVLGTVPWSQWPGFVVHTRCPFSNGPSEYSCNDIDSYTANYIVYTPNANVGFGYQLQCNGGETDPPNEGYVDFWPHPCWFGDC